MLLGIAECGCSWPNIPRVWRKWWQIKNLPNKTFDWVIWPLLNANLLCYFIPCRRFPGRSAVKLLLYLFWVDGKYKNWWVSEPGMPPWQHGASSVYHWELSPGAAPSQEQGYSTHLLDPTTTKTKKQSIKHQKPSGKFTTFWQICFEQNWR